MGEKKNFSANSCGKTRYPHAKEQVVPLPSTIHKKELKTDQDLNARPKSINVFKDRRKA